MPSGRTHDSITLWSLPLVAGVTFERTHNASVTLLLSGGYLFSGLMFGPDLDIHSQQYKRWGVLRWIWLPYRRSMRHRSFLSHGVLLGTAIRILYLLTWLLGAGGAVVFLSAIAYGLVGEFPTWNQGFWQTWHWSLNWFGRSLQHHTPAWIALLIGLELGALSHSLSDWVGSRYKRFAPHKPKPAASKPSRLPPDCPPATVSPAPPTPSPPGAERLRQPSPSPPPKSARIELPKLPQDPKLPPM